jgi:hypothetical protein
MQQCWLNLVSHCLGPGAALENMFAWVILAYLQNLGGDLGFWGVFLGSKLAFKRDLVNAA